MEFPILLLGTRAEPARAFLSTLLINCLTLPAATYLYRSVYPHLFLIECAVIVVEVPLIHYLFHCSWRRAALLSLVANGCTALIGILLPPGPVL
ncbi:MAG: hypothetical protein LUQ64_03780 [Methanomicrobiales archaeon]|nr:hypothetical protein [Methanomicrobiales archaeon]